MLVIKEAVFMDASEKLDLNAVDLRNAVLCADCEVISDSPHDTCRICGSHSLLSMSRVLGGTLPLQRAHLVETWHSEIVNPVISIKVHKRDQRLLA
jgi:hypothetical protein